MSKKHDMEKARHWQTVIRDAARSVLPAAETEGEPVLLVAASIEGKASARFDAPRLR